MNPYVGLVSIGRSSMPETLANAPLSSCYRVYSGQGIKEDQRLAPDLSHPRARDARGQFANGIPNPRRRVPDLAAPPSSAQALAGLLDRKPLLLRPLAAQVLAAPCGFSTLACGG